MKITNHVCKECGEPFVTEPVRKPRSFCGDGCNKSWRRKSMKGNQWAAGNVPTVSSFKPGSAPWNKGKKGIHLSPSSEFKNGQKPATYLPVGSVTVRTTKRDGRDRAWIKVSEPNKWRLRAVVIWEIAHGPVPSDKVVHHKDHSTLNDVLENLELKTRAEHIEEHRLELLEARKNKAKP